MNPLKPEHNSEDYLKNAYLGEVRGEAIFRTLAKAMPERAAAWQLLADVEKYTAEYLLNHLNATVEPDSIAEQHQKAAEQVGTIAQGDWFDALDRLLPIVSRALDTMKAAEQHAPPELLSAYQTYTAHEQALADYLKLERSGQVATHILKDYLRRNTLNHT